MKKYFCLLSMTLLLYTMSGCGMEKQMGEAQVSAEETGKAAEDDEDVLKEEEENAGRDTDGARGNSAPEASEKETETETAEEASEDTAEKPLTMAELMGNTGNAEEEEEELPATVLWFNATYAPLTYSNGWNWRLVGGLKPTEENKELSKLLLWQSWSVSDRASAFETVERLKKDGHRAKCRECMETLAEREWLDLEEEDFLNALMDSDIEENLFRYVIAYYMYQDGVDADYIAAWDLCRVNQLYADFYFCGYMTYEEAMDASLENSFLLQSMYSSWEEMVSAYMLGYQFWQSDPCISEDSPTMERYRYYEMLLEIEDGPYTLPWKMKLQKSW